MINGVPSLTDKRFMAYLVSSEKSEPKYDAWLCGGAIVSPRQILTSAACLSTVSHIYAIAGYRKYVNGKAIEYDECTKRMKQKVISHCVPRNYNISQEVSQWIVLDVGVAVVEHPYDFRDRKWLEYCTWIPGSIRVSYKRHKVKTDVLAFGWGGKIWRAPKDRRDLNSKYLQEIYSLIERKRFCRNTNKQNLLEISKWIYCVTGEGNVDAEGNTRSEGIKDRYHWIPNDYDDRRRMDGNVTEERRRVVDVAYLLNILANGTIDCPVMLKQESNNEEFPEYNFNSSSKMETERTEGSKIPQRRWKQERKRIYPSICVGDHGGPLVTWEGSEMVLIGVAVTPRVDSQNHYCHHPSIFTSTYCAGLVIDCMLRTSPTALRSCNVTKKSGIVILETTVNWINSTQEVKEKVMTRAGNNMTKRQDSETKVKDTETKNGIFPAELNDDDDIDWEGDIYDEADDHISKTGVTNQGIDKRNQDQ